MNLRICVLCGCFLDGSGGYRSEFGRTEGGVLVVWPVDWVVTAGAAESG